MNSFAVEFFRLYDRKMLSGELTFSELGLSKDDFTRLCTDSDFALNRKQTEELCERMRLNEDEAKRLLDTCQA